MINTFMLRKLCPYGFPPLCPQVRIPCMGYPESLSVNHLFIVPDAQPQEAENCPRLMENYLSPRDNSGSFPGTSPSAEINIFSSIGFLELSIFNLVLFSNCLHSGSANIRLFGFFSVIFRSMYGGRFFLSWVRA